MSLFPLDETDLPERPTMVTVSSFVGGGTVVLANLIHNLNFYYSMMR
jgi:hypothetical protein